MPIVDSNGNLLCENDLRALTDMLQGSYENHIGRLEDYKNRYTDEQTAEYFDRIIGVYREAIDSLEDDIQSAVNGRRKLSVPELSKRLNDGLTGRIKKVWIPAYKEAHRGFREQIAAEWGDDDLMPMLTDSGDQNQPGAFKKSARSFKFSKTPIEGIESIGEYDPARDRVTALYEGRAQGSFTMTRVMNIDQLIEKSKNHKEHSLEHNLLKQQIDSAQRAPFGLHAGAELSRIHSDELRSKETVTFGDLYDVLSSLNEAARGYADGSGKLRGYGVRARKIKGVGASHTPQVMYETLEKIADGMNSIKRTDDPRLRKSMAVELAAFSYQMLLSEHLFMDGNGRSCRLFADTILQTFGLPPHIPGTLSEMGKVSPRFVGSLGDPLDFKAGTQYFMNGIRKSDAILKEQRELAGGKNGSLINEPGQGIEAVGAPLEDNLIDPPLQEEKKSRRRKSSVPEVTKDTLQYMKNLIDNLEDAKSSFRNSQEYKDLVSAAYKCRRAAKKIYDNRNKPEFDKSAAYWEYEKAIRAMRSQAKVYENYKVAQLKEKGEYPADGDLNKLTDADAKKKLTCARLICQDNEYLGKMTSERNHRMTNTGPRTERKKTL